MPQKQFANREPVDDLDWNDKAARSLIEATCAVTGVPVP
jgi:hypothetical protein